MCLKPISVKNPLLGQSRYYSEEGLILEMNKRFFNHKDEYIEVACGKCDECRTSHFSALLQRCLVECRTSYLYFVTLTYDDKHIPSITLPSGQIIFYTDYSDVQLLIKRFRNSKLLDRDWRYLCALEYGDQKSRPHVHLLFFVAKLDDDTPDSPFIIESIFRDNLKKLWARNIGTRKKPVYEPLFTYAVRYTSTGLKSNYFVQYVYRDTTIGSDLLDNSYRGLTKAIRYLIGYVNKGSRFDDTIISYLDDLDLKLSQSLKRCLCSKVIYSKGLGSGFSSGHKVNLQPVSRTSSYMRLLYSNFVDKLPHDFATFAEQEPHLVTKLINFIKGDTLRYRNWHSLDMAVSHFRNEDDYFCHFLILKYFPRYFSSIYRRYWRDYCIATVAYHFYFNREYRYATHRIVTGNHTDCDSFRFVRQGVEEAIYSKVPYLSFKVETDQSFIGLCKYYRERCTTFADIEMMYNWCGFKDYNSWKNSFEHNLDLRKSNKVQGHKESHFNDDILKSQKKSLYLNRNLAGVELYTTVL